MEVSHGILHHIIYSILVLFAVTQSDMQLIFPLYADKGEIYIW